MMKKLVFLAFPLILLSSCESEIEIDLPPPQEMVVVDGVIEMGEYARVTITKSMPYFSQIDLASLASIVVSDAVVVLTDGIVSDTLSFTIDPDAFPPVYYKGTNPLLIGQPGVVYTLNITALGKFLTSKTTIPPAIPLDSLYWKPNAEGDSLGLGWGHLTDPDTMGNIYRMFVKRQGYPFYVPAAGRSTLDDKLFNGLSTDFSFARPDPYPSWIGNEDDDERFYFKRGDTIMVKFCTLDVISYQFVRTYEIAAGSFGNPFSAPTFVKSNIAGGLGGWIGYGVSYHTYIVPQ